MTQVMDKEAMRRETAEALARYNGKVTRGNTAVASQGAGVDLRGFAQCRLARKGK